MENGQRSFDSDAGFEPTVDVEDDFQQRLDGDATGPEEFLATDQIQLRSDEKPELDRQE